MNYIRPIYHTNRGDTVGQTWESNRTIFESILLNERLNKIIFPEKEVKETFLLKNVPDKFR